MNATLAIRARAADLAKWAGHGVEGWSFEEVTDTYRLLPGQTGLTNSLFAEAVGATTALPHGVLNIVTEVGNALAPALVDSADVDVISYTGSTAVGRVIAAAGAKTLKRVGLELGGKTPLAVLDDADLDRVVLYLTQTVLTMNGEFCLTGSRVLVHRHLADELRERLIDAYRRVRTGISEDSDTELGPLIDKRSVGRVAQLAQDADVPLVQQEVFGPVQPFEIFDDDSDAVSRANATEYGLAAAIFTRDDTRGRKVGREIKAGIVWTKCWGCSRSRAATASCTARAPSKSSSNSRSTSRLHRHRTGPFPPQATERT